MFHYLWVVEWSGLLGTADPIRLLGASLICWNILTVLIHFEEMLPSHPEIYRKLGQLEALLASEWLNVIR